MQVKLIDYTGACSIDPLYAARLLLYIKDTRLERGGADFFKVQELSEAEVLERLKEVAITIRSSWEFVDFTWEITGVTRAFTHQFVRTRTASYAQQSQRTVEMEGFEYMTPESIGPDSGRYITDGTKTLYSDEVWDDCMASIQDAYDKLISMGIPAQDARGVLPTNILTSINAKINLRTFADLVGKRTSLRAQGEYASVVRRMVEVATEAMPWLAPFLSPERTTTPHLDALLAQAMGGRGPGQCPEVWAALKEVEQLKATWG